MVEPKYPETCGTKHGHLEPVPPPSLPEAIRARLATVRTYDMSPTELEKMVPNDLGGGKWLHADEARIALGLPPEDAP